MDPKNRILHIRTPKQDPPIYRNSHNIVAAPMECATAPFGLSASAYADGVQPGSG